MDKERKNHIFNILIAIVAVILVVLLVLLFQAKKANRPISEEEYRAKLKEQYSNELVKRQEEIDQENNKIREMKTMNTL